MAAFGARAERGRVAVIREGENDGEKVASRRATTAAIGRAAATRQTSDGRR